MSVLREHYPEDKVDPGGFLTALPGHQVTLLPPVTVINLLPLELHYYLKGTHVSGNLKPGHEAALHGVSTQFTHSCAWSKHTVHPQLCMG